MTGLPRFDVRFDIDAWKEYEGLDGSIRKIVNNFLDKLELRADEIGKPLENLTNSKLYGCKEFKLRSYGIRIVFKVTDNVVDILRIVYILAIERRSNDFVFKLATKRHLKFRNISEDNSKAFLKKLRRYKRD